MADKTLQLKYPVKHDGKEYTELTFGRLKLKHLKILPTDFADKWANGEIEFQAIIPLLAGICNVPEEVIEEIDVESDMDVIAEGIKGFFVDTLDKTGKS